MNVGEVGIWWLWKKQLIKSSTPYTNGIISDRFINGPNDHYKYWEIVQTMIKELRATEYEEIPRGRVIYDTKNKRFYCYTSRMLCRNKMLRSLVIENFKLDEKSTTFRQDDHYEEP